MSVTLYRLIENTKYIKNIKNIILKIIIGEIIMYVYFDDRQIIFFVNNIVFKHQ